VPCQFYAKGASIYCRSSQAGQTGIPITYSGGAALKNKLAVVFTLAIGFLSLPRPVFAHHAAAAFDMEHAVTMKGTVTMFEWSNPHALIYLDVKDAKGNVERWRVEGNSPNMLTRVGWNKEMIKPRDQLTVIGFSARNGRKIMRLDSIMLANGQKFDGQGLNY
jgi:hypothetical protein